MQHDITDGVQYLIDEGIADPERIAIFGGSYGGYATLAGVTFTPDLYACGIPYVGAVQPHHPDRVLPGLLAAVPRRDPGTGGSAIPTIEADRRDLHARSPLTLRRPDQGRRCWSCTAPTTRGSSRPSPTRSWSPCATRGADVEYIVAPDEGHGFRAPENRMALAVAMEQFLAKHLGGRVQEDVPEDVAARLAEITVDVGTVKMPETKG